MKRVHVFGLFFSLGWIGWVMLFFITLTYGGGPLLARVKDGDIYYVNHSVYTLASWSNFLNFTIAYVVCGLFFISSAVVGFKIRKDIKGYWASVLFGTFTLYAAIAGYFEIGRTIGRW